MATKKKLEVEREKSLAERFAEKKAADKHSLAERFAEKKRQEKEQLKELESKTKSLKKPFFARLFKRSKKENAEKPAESEEKKEAPKEETPKAETPKAKPEEKKAPEEKKDEPKAELAEEKKEEPKTNSAEAPKAETEKPKSASTKTPFFARLFKKKPVEEGKTIPESATEKSKDSSKIETAKNKPEEKPEHNPKDKTNDKEPIKKSFFTRFKALFTSKKEKSVEPVKHAKKGKKRLSLLDRKKKIKKKRERRTSLQQRRILANLTMKAGFDVNPEKLKRVVFYLSFGLVALFTFLSLLVAAASGKSAGKLILFYLGVWTAVFAFVYIFIWMIIYFYLDIRIYNRTQELEDVLPDFLQLASANISAGMPIDRALWFAVRPNFGVLAKEIEEVAKSTLAGEELNESLLKFTEKYDSVTLKRSINILLEGLDAGGEIADLLNKIALNIQETKIQRKEMSANVATYAIFITFASIIMAPLLFALATELLTIIVNITSNLDLGSSTSSFITINIDTSMGMVDDFRVFCIMMLTISALMSASIVSVIRRGRVKEGLRNLPIFTVVSLVIYFFASKLLHVMLGGLI